VTDVLGGVAAHYCYDPVTIDGLVSPHCVASCVGPPRGRS
jgi:hypothetical protein